MHYIHKYYLEAHLTPQTLPLHAGASFLRVAKRSDGWCTWWTDDPVQDQKPVTVQVFATGARFSEGERCSHLGTFFEGDFVWHLFQIRP